MQTIVKAESLALVGAHIFKVKRSRMDGSAHHIDQHTLPTIPEPNAQPRYSPMGQLLHSPNWSLSVKHNIPFINAVVAAVEKVHVSLHLFLNCLNVNLALF